ncbi:unnamed protein product [Didymodactylos carnosus]|uniref:Uncharacterized protein n=1 Tax=Didymodactylos carnosus TaxID=1234261 RepID=A0A815K6R7_9BILA|nr:unnamed protein product [Didymodactylos carnosus]CAF1537833.1 unnamed protein product [Didymodactylos carnosus]CAF4286131.1 unnamed protein product [Didymodactylos carnosus]CAF4325752.1 unnamed protein product [Didymodactylos carnosus]
MGPKFRRQAQLSVINQIRLSGQSLNDESKESSEDEQGQMGVKAKPDTEPINFGDKIILNGLMDVFELCKAKCGLKQLSCLLYMTLRHLGIRWRDCNAFMTEVGAFTTETAHKWTEFFISGDFEEFNSENRGNKQFGDFYDYFPDIEIEAKLFTLNRCSQKNADFF